MTGLGYNYMRGACSLFWESTAAAVSMAPPSLTALARTSLDGGAKSLAVDALSQARHSLPLELLFPCMRALQSRLFATLVAGIVVIVVATVVLVHSLERSTACVSGNKLYPRPASNL